MKSITSYLLLLGFLISYFSVSGQTEQELLAQLLEEEHQSVEALALYPDATRRHILEAAQYPEALIKLESIQSRISDTFKKLMENYPQATQEMIWDLTRYPGLVANIVEANGATPEVLAGFPSEIHPRAQMAAEGYMPLLMEVQRLQIQSDEVFGNLLKDYPPKTQDALRNLVALPEVLTLLTDNIRLTVMVGDLYRRRPEWLLQQMDSLNLVAAKERTQEIEDWKASLEINPQAKEELMQSAEDFAGSYNYDDAYYNDDIYADGDNEPVVVHNYYYNYPYWFGYPHWYDYPRWRPYPYWYDWGFYWGPGQMIIIVDLPSFHFTHWYFHHPWHHRHYSHLSSHFANHYYGHRHSAGGVTAGVDDWRRQNREVVTDKWLDEARKRPESFQEYGKFEEERTKYNEKNLEKPVSQGDFLDKNRKKYPDMDKQVEPRRDKEPAQREQPPTVTQPRKEQPQVEKPKTQLPPPTPKPTPKEPRKKNENPPTVSPDVPKVDKARERHETIWDKTKKETTQPRPAPKKETTQPRPAPKAPTVKPPKTRTQKPAPAPKTKKERGGG